MNQDNFFKNIESLKFLAKKEVGQNFLIDQEAAKSIVNALDIQNEDKVLEIGSGPGSLTFFLKDYQTQIDCIDIDEGFILKIKEDFKEYENLNISLGNAMNFDYSKYNKIVSNLPYYITSGIIENILLYGFNVKKCVFMVQKEVVSRLMCQHGSEDITPLTLFLNYLCEIKKLFNVGRNNFVPAPNVDSTVFELNFKDGLHTQESVDVYKFVKKMFINKRKTILNNLKNGIKTNIDFLKALEEAEISPSLRPEQINFNKFIRLYSIITKSE